MLNVQLLIFKSVFILSIANSLTNLSVNVCGSFFIQKLIASIPKVWGNLFINSLHRMLLWYNHCYVTQSAEVSTNHF